MVLQWILNLSDDRHSLLDVAERAGMPLTAIREAATLLVAHELPKPSYAASGGRASRERRLASVAERLSERVRCRCSLPRQRL